jgi:hypothetical protein
MGRARTRVRARAAIGVGRAWCAERRGAGRSGRTGRARTRVGRGRRPASGGHGAPDGGAPDEEGARAARRTEGHRTERAHGPGTHASGGVGGGVGRWRAGGEVGLFPAGAGGESVSEIWKLLRVCGLGT